MERIHLDVIFLLALNSKAFGIALSIFLNFTIESLFCNLATGIAHVEKKPI